MRIAFDLDDTVIPSMYSFPTEMPARRIMGRLFGHVPLRKGAANLLRFLRKDGHDIWIYTTSLRSPFQVRQVFAIPGISLGGIVNGDVHAKRMKTLAPEVGSCSKYPPAFGIDVLVDDSEGVVLEGKKFGFCVFHVRPDDAKWVRTVSVAVGLLRDSRVAA